MAAPTRRERLGVTHEMIEAFGPIIFDLSTNVQDRRGDPVRLLQFDEIERQRPGTGLSDPEIAQRLGLAADQVTFIRVLLEQRRFKPARYYRLFQLGGGRRFRTERGMERDPYEEPQFSTDALAIRDALRFRPDHVRRELESGRWTADTVAGYLQRWARETPDAIAVAAPSHPPVSYGAALDRTERLAAALAALGVQRGDVVTVQLPSTPEFLVIYYAVARLGGVLSTCTCHMVPLKPSRCCAIRARVPCFAAAPPTNPTRPGCSRRLPNTCQIFNTSSPSGRRDRACMRWRR